MDTAWREGLSLLENARSLLRKEGTDTEYLDTHSKVPGHIFLTNQINRSARFEADSAITWQFLRGSLWTDLIGT